MVLGELGIVEALLVSSLVVGGSVTGDVVSPAVGLSVVKYVVTINVVSSVDLVDVCSVAGNVVTSAVVWDSLVGPSVDVSPIVDTSLDRRSVVNNVVAS